MLSRKDVGRYSERGNAFILVLLGIALFTGLSFMVARSMQSETTARMSNRETKLAASEMIEYGARVERAVSKLRQRGCSENDISFDDHKGFAKLADGSAVNYSNSGSPGDFSCHVFESDGGNVEPRLPVPSKVAVDVTDVNAAWMHPQSFAVVPMRIAGVGTDTGAGGTDLVMWIGRLKRDACVAVNAELGLSLTNNPPTESFDCDNTVFTGSFPDCSDPIGDGVTELEGQTAFCLQDPDGGDEGYIYFQVLMER